MSDTPKVAGRHPVAVELEQGKKYAFCTCGGSSNQPFCDGSHSGPSFTPHVFTAEKSGQAHLCMCKRTGNVPFCDGTHATLDEAQS
jgi:CDGSH-type Zn-finger protein